jgi:hypothetical protein
MERASTMRTRIVLAVLGLFHIANGVWMVLAPMSWYVAIPGVAETGPLNHHFVADIGLAFIASGAGLLAGLRKNTAMLAMAGATWPALHALLHIWGWLVHGFPPGPNVFVSETVGVVIIGAVGVLAAWLNARKQGAVG